MGTWPTRYGNDTGSLPPGLTLPNTTSATAGPACTPGNHASSSADVSATMFSSASGRPLNSTTAYGLPLAFTASISSSCLPGRSSFERAFASPLISRVSPTATTTCWASASAAFTAAVSIDVQPSGSRSLGSGSWSKGTSPFDSSQPAAYVAPGLCSLMPSKTVTTSSSSPRPHHGPSMSCWFFASGPTTAVFLEGSSGSTPPSFFSSTIERLAAVRAAATASGFSISALASAGSNGAYGFSNSPARNLMRRILRTASLIRLIEMRPSPSSCSPKSRKNVLVISMSTPLLSARAAAPGPSSATPWPHSGTSSGLTGGQERSSPTAVQSLSTKTSKSHWPLRMSFIRYELPHPGTPLSALNEHITVSAPASSAALNGGRYRFHNRCIDMSVVL